MSWKSKLLKEYKENGLIKTKRNYAGSYTATIGEYKFIIEDNETREIYGGENEWMVCTLEGSKNHDERDTYVGHYWTLTDALIGLVTDFHK